HDERPRFALGSRDFGVDEHVLDLLAAAREPVARPPASYLKAWERRFNAPWAPAHGAVERDRGLLEPNAVVLAHRGEPAAEVEPLRAGPVGQELVELRRALLGRSKEVLPCRGVEPLEERDDLAADQPALRIGIRGVGAVLEAFRAAVRLGLVAP